MSKLILFWLLFFVSHSVFASTYIKEYATKTFQLEGQAYRLFFNIISFLTFGLVLWALFSQDSPKLFAVNTVGIIASILLILSGLYVLKAAFSNINLASFLGLASPEQESQGLVVSGWYKFIRHPLYFGTFLALIGVFLLEPSQAMLLSVLFSILYIIIGIEFEEIKLRKIFGNSYIEYAKGKKKFIPFVY